LIFMIRTAIHVLCVISFVFLVSGEAAAARLRPEKLTVVYTEWYPYTYGEESAAEGFEIDTFKSVMDKMGIKVEFLKFPFKRCLKMLEDGNAQVLISILKTPERQKYAIFPEEHISISKTLFFTKTDARVQYKGSFKNLKNHSIGVIAGFSYGKAFDNAAYLNKDEVLDAERLIKMVLGGRYEIGIEDQAVVKGVARKLGVERSVRFLYPPVHTEKLYVGFSRKAGLRRLAADFSKFLAQFKRTDEYKAILRKYGIAYSDMSQMDELPSGN